MKLKTKLGFKKYGCQKNLKVLNKKKYLHMMQNRSLIKIN